MTRTAHATDAQPVLKVAVVDPSTGTAGILNECTGDVLGVFESIRSAGLVLQHNCDLYRRLAQAMARHEADQRVRQAALAALSALQQMAVGVA